LPIVELTYNCSVHGSTKFSPFKVVSDFNPCVPIDLMPIPIDKRTSIDGIKKEKIMKILHKQVRSHIEEKTTKYAKHANKRQKMVRFKSRDLVRIHLSKDRFTSKRKSKLMPRVNGPFRVIERVNDNVYKINLPSKYNVLATFIVKDLSPYLKDVDNSDFRKNHFQLEGNDMHYDSNIEEADSNMYGYSNGLMMIVREKQLQSTLISQISIIEALMGLKACKLNENGLNMFVYFQISLG